MRSRCAGKEDRQMDKVFLIGHEERLAQILKGFIAFSRCVIYFPSLPLLSIELLDDENALLAPLIHEGQSLGAIRLEGLDMINARKVAPFLQGIISLALANLALEDGKDRDPDTGLLTESALLEGLARKFNQSGLDGVGSGLCIGMVVIVWPQGNVAQRRLRQEEFVSLNRQLAAELLNGKPEQGFAGRLGWVNGNHAFGVVFPASGRGAAHRQARKLLAAMQEILLAQDIAREGVNAGLLAGHALYPQDMRGSEMRLGALERARILRNRARLAAEMAWEAEHLSMPVLGYAWIASQAGRIVELFDSGMVKINLGSDANVVAGDRFHVVHPGDERAMEHSKGQLVVRVVGKRDSQAKILHIDQPGRPPAVGDLLVPACAVWPVVEESGILMSQKRFQEKFALARQGCQKFCLAIARFTIVKQFSQLAGPPQDLHRRLSRLLQSSFFAELKSGFAGWYGSAGIIIFLPGATAREGMEFCKNLHDLALSVGFSCSVGLFPYPFLNFRRADSEACALKALAYAELLPEPHIGVFDHLALTISADRRFSEGDELGAMEEYRLALLLKPNDASILNSLGVCMGALNRASDATRLFTAAAENCADAALAARIFYNLGAVHEKENDLFAARSWFRKCVRNAPEHIYAWIRLGRIYAQTGRLAGSRALYHRALRLATNQPRLINVIERHLAHMEASRSQTEKARELLHDALLRDPADGESLLMLAQTYLEDEPAIAEQLARRCVRMGMDAWMTLADALEALGLPEEAARARISRG